MKKMNHFSMYNVPFGHVHSKFSFVLSLALLSLMVTACGVANDGDENWSQPLTEYETNNGGQKNVLDAQGQGSGNKFSDFTDNPFVSTSQQSVSTFSVDADGASYGIMRRYISEGYSVNPSSVRIEEFLNYFTFDYPSPSGDHCVAINAEVGDCPWNDGHKLLRLGIKGKELSEDKLPQANFVFLIDVSGSMASTDKLDLLKSGLKQLLYQLKSDDRISIVTYSGEVQKLLESTPVSQVGKIEQTIDKLTASGATAGGEALKIAYEEAMANYNPQCNNRVIMGTDGDFNVGVTSTDALVEMVESYARKGIYMTCLGFGSGNLNDAMMERISNAGNGTYNYIDCEDEMMKVFVHERSRFVSVANDVKCQVTFNTDIVSLYRLIGYENRVMSKEDFENDKKDAGEIGAGQTITALYELELKTNAGSNAGQVFATFDLRYKRSLDSESIPLQQELTADQLFNKNGRSADFHFAAGVAAYGMLLRNSPYMGTATKDMALGLVRQGLVFDPYGRRAELVKLIEYMHH